MTMLLAIATSPSIVNSQPFPMASRRGCATIPPTHEKMFRTKLFVATPDDDFRGINSVSMVVAIPKTSIDPTPKKKFAMSYVKRQLTCSIVKVRIDLQVRPKRLPFEQSIRTI